MTTTVAMIGAGTIGRTHLAGAAKAEGVQIVGVADPSPAAEALARKFGVPHFMDQWALNDALRPDGPVIATPNTLHVPSALEWIAQGKAVLVEKPVAGTVAEGHRLVQATSETKVPVLVGHHRRHNPTIRHARELVQSGVLGWLVCATVLATFLKPNSYFEPAWRLIAGGRPVLINLIHEIDLLRFVCGEVISLQALTSNGARSFEVEDTAAMLLRLANGAVAHIMLSVTAAALWSWELSSDENPAFAKSNQESHLLSGTKGLSAFPTLRMRNYAGERGWNHPLLTKSEAVAAANPYAEQMRHFGAVIGREEQPVIDALDTTCTLEVTMAVRQVTQSGAVVY